LILKARLSQAKTAQDYANKVLYFENQYYYRIHAVTPYTFLLFVVSPASKHDLRILEKNISETNVPVIMKKKRIFLKSFKNK